VRAYAAGNPGLQQRFEQEIDLHRRARYRTLKLLALHTPVWASSKAAGTSSRCCLSRRLSRIQAGRLDSQGFSKFFMWRHCLMLIDPTLPTSPPS